MFGSPDNKPSAAEQMVAKLLGFTPAEMQEQLMSFRNTIVAVADTLKRLEDKQDAILLQLEALRNDDRNDNSSGGPVALLGGGSGNAGGSDSGG